MTRGKTTTAAVALAAALLLGGAQGVQAASDSAAGVTGWIDVTLREISAHRLNPPRAARVLALVSVAVDRVAPDGALHGAAAAVLDDLFPDDRSAIDGRAAALATPAELSRGAAAAAPVIDWAHHDGSDSTAAPMRPTGADFWEPTPPAYAPALEPAAGTWRTWNLESGDALRPHEPPRPGSPAFERGLREVYDTAQSLTDEQRRIAHYWADGPGGGPETPPGHWNRVAIELINAAGTPTRDAARLFAVLNTAQADALVAVWDAKFTYWSIRPVTAIRRTIDAGWLPLIPTPPFPSYVSGHAAVAGAATTVLSKQFHANAHALHDAADEAALSRLYAGIHFRIDNKTGLELGRRVADAALKHSKHRTAAPFTS